MVQVDGNLPAEQFKAARALAQRQGDARAEGVPLAGLGSVAVATGDLDLAGAIRH